MSRYSYSCQYAQSGIDEVDHKGAASTAEIVAAFDAFDWRGQVESANQLQRCSPTFSVTDAEVDREFWVSVVGEPTAFKFVNQYTYQGEIRRFLGLRRSVGSICPRSRELTFEEARIGIGLFVAGDHERLLELLR